VRKGYRVAICEQTEDASKTKKLVRREVVRIVTPGTPIDPQLLEARESVYLAAVCAQGETVGAAFLDISTGEFRATQASGKHAWERIVADIESYAPPELIFPQALSALVRAGFRSQQKTGPLPLQTGGRRQDADGRQNENEPADSQETTAPPAVLQSAARLLPPVAGLLPFALTPLDDWLWQAEDCSSLLIKQFNVRSLDGYGLTRKTEAIRAAGACLRYAQDTQRAAASHIADIVYFEPQDHLVLDHITVRNLELVQATGGASRSLLDVIDETVTGMGARLLRAWLLRPSIHRGEIEARHGAVAELHASHAKRDRLRTLLKEVSDVERLVGRLNLGSATPAIWWRCGVRSIKCRKFVKVLRTLSLPCSRS
jgi:DNA mismatch repair protein MutS